MMPHRKSKKRLREFRIESYNRFTKYFLKHNFKVKALLNGEPFVMHFSQINCNFMLYYIQKYACIYMYQNGIIMLFYGM